MILSVYKHVRVMWFNIINSRMLECVLVLYPKLNHGKHFSMKSDVRNGWSIVVPHPLTLKIQLVILPTDYHIFLCKLGKRIECYVKITRASCLLCLFSKPVCRITHSDHKATLHVSHSWELKGYDTL